MVQREYHSTREDGVKLFRSYSDKGVLIRKRSTKQTYAEAIDVESAPYRYEETETPIKTETSLENTENN